MPLMKHSAQSVEQARQNLVEQIAAITTMQPGTLAEEYREHPDPHGKGTVRRGPYFKHQVWRDGRNVSRRVPADEAVGLREDIENARCFHDLTAQLAKLNIEHTLSLRAAQAPQAATPDAKKNSTRKPAGKDSPKRKPSSPKPGRA